ncbi:MAG TPA: hypothetical protein VMV92_17195 [Streptosporangiaceae bacterium]|nr:hypothetical protein [Streptosporangiaceae bacterium]
MTTRALCARLADLALVTLISAADGGSITVHDVIRDFLRDHLGATHLAKKHQVLLDAMATGLPRTPDLAGDHGEVTAWWKLPGDARYAWEHVIEHMLAAGQVG